MAKRNRSSELPEEQSKKLACNLELFNETSKTFPNHEYQVLPTTRSSCGDVSGKRVLVLGCADGSCYRSLLGEPAVIVAIFASESQLAVARKLDRLEDKNNVSYFATNFFASQNFLGPFDVIILNFALSRSKQDDMKANLQSVAKKLAPQGVVVINHSLGVVPANLIEQTTQWTDTCYASIPPPGLAPGTPYEVLYAASSAQPQKHNEYYYPIEYLEQQLMQAGLKSVENVAWLETFPDDYERRFPREELQQWLDEGGQIASQLTARFEPLPPVPQGPFVAKDYRTLWNKVLRSIGRLTVEKFGSFHLLTLVRPEDAGDVIDILTGFTFGCNTCLAETLCGDKKITHSILSYANVPVVEHMLVPGVRQSNFALTAPRWPDVVRFFETHSNDVVLKDTHGRTGYSVYRARTMAELESAFYKLQTRSSMVITPFIPAEYELRVLVFPRLKKGAGLPRKVSDFELSTPLLWRKRPMQVVGDGVSTLSQLVQAAAHGGTTVSSVVAGLEKSADKVLAVGDTWRSWMFNHSQGSEWERVDAKEAPEACEVAIRAARALGIWYGAVDVLQPQGVVLEVNHQIVTDALDMPIHEAVVIARAALSLRAALRRECMQTAATVASTFTLSSDLPLIIKLDSESKTSWQQNNNVRRKLIESVWKNRGAKTLSFDHGYLLLAHTSSNTPEQQSNPETHSSNNNRNSSSSSNSSSSNSSGSGSRNENLYWNVLYDMGTVFSTDADVTSSKSICSLLLQRAEVPCVAHDLLFASSSDDPRWGLNNALETLKHINLPCVLKPDGGSGGYGVVVVDTQAAAETVLLKSWSSVCISPYVRIKTEYRCVTVGGKVVLTLTKQRPTVRGDGVSTVAELLARWAKTGPRTLYNRVVDEWSKVLTGTTLWSTPTEGEEILASWKHNLDCGSIPVLCQPPARVTEQAEQAARALGLLYCAVDVVEVDNQSSDVLVLEVNSTPMWNQTAQHLPHVAKACIQAAVDVVRLGSTKPPYAN